MLGGVMTTGCVLAFLIYLLCDSSDEWREMRKEKQAIKQAKEKALEKIEVGSQRIAKEKISDKEKVTRNSKKN